MFDWRNYGNGIYAFDAGYVRPILAAIHVVVEDGRVALIDTGSNDSLPNALVALERLGLDIAAVDYVILTHIHLDHAGGAGRMMAMFPNARLVVHPRGARHMAEPSRLVAGVSAVYGREYVERVYGEILPIPETRIIEANDALPISLAGRELLCIDTPGHARHHICVIDRKSGGIFTGDMFGLSYRELDVDERPFIFPTTTPTQFEPGEMKDSIARLMEFAPPAMYLTHYGQVRNVPQLAIDLCRRLDMLVMIGLSAQALSGAVRHQHLKRKMSEYLFAELKQHGCTLGQGALLDIWETDLELNAQGIEVWLDSRETA